MSLRFPTDSYPLCIVCQRLRPNDGGRLTCMAFPVGIPEAILEGTADHRHSYPGDSGIHFEPDWDAPTSTLIYLARLPWDLPATQLALLPSPDATPLDRTASPV